LDARPDLDFVSCAMRGFGEASYVWTPPPPELARSLAGEVVHVSSLLRRSAFARVGGFDESLPDHEDLDLWISLLAAGSRGEVLPEPLLRYRVRAGSRFRRAVGE